jgi:hypothetical protein
MSYKQRQERVGQNVVAVYPVTLALSDTICPNQSYASAPDAVKYVPSLHRLQLRRVVAPAGRI